MSDPSSSAPTPPNVLLITADHWGASFLRSAGHPVVMTPTIDQLSRAGVRFANCYSATPVCIPARRALMTGLTSQTHGDRVFKERDPMPAGVPTMAQCFRNAGYQAFAVGKLHVYPQRDRIGFDDVILNEEGRHQFGMTADDWELELAERGFGGQEYAGGGGNNDYHVRPWHLPDELHQTSWTSRHMCRMIHRRNPTKPGFWYMSFAGPHQPMWPLRDYLDQYRDFDIDEPVFGEWSKSFDELPQCIRRRNSAFHIRNAPKHERDLARRAFYACITHIDHQIRIVIGYLREQGLLGNTIIAFTADHGDMLGDHGLWAKSLMYDQCMKVPLVVLPTQGDQRIRPYTVDNRLVELRDVMPTLLDLAGLPIPAHVEGVSLVRQSSREYLYGEMQERTEVATRMIRDSRHKLIWYPAGNRVQLFDLIEDPRECVDLSSRSEHQATIARLSAELVKHLHSGDERWVRDGKLVGEPDSEFTFGGDRSLHGQRGLRFM